MSMTELELRAALEQTFGLTFQVYKEKLAYWMVIWHDKSDGTVFGPFAGHGHRCRLAGFEFEGWAYAYDGSKWYLLPDGAGGWRNKGSTNPFPELEEKNLATW